MNKTISLLKFLIGWPLAIVAIFFLIRLFLPQFTSIQARIVNVNILLLIASVILFVGYYFLRCYLWKTILQFKGHRIPFMRTAYLWEISEFKRYTPGNIWSFLSRVSLFENEGIDKKLVGLALLDEIQLIIISCAFISLFCLPLVLNSGESVQLLKQMQTIILGSAVAIVIYSLVVAFLFKKRGVGNFRANLFLPGYSLKQKVILTLISIVAFFTFGVATLTACLSVFSFEPKLFLELSAFFTFALLTGYLSFITPMGLGVRESIITLGLSRLTSVATAGFLSIFSRIVLIISEISFLGIILLFNMLSKQNIMNFLKRHKYEIALGVFILTYIAYFSVASLLRYSNFYTGRFDLGNMDQAVWNTIHGRIFQITDPNGTATISRLAFHADFILILISPLYLIWSNPQALLLLQTVVLALGAIFVFLITNALLKNKNLSLTFAAVYLLNPALQFSNLYDFHAIVLATTLLLATFYFYLRRKYLFFLVFAILAGLAKEEVWAIISLFGLAIVYRITFENKFRLKFSRRQVLAIISGLFIFLISAFVCYLLIWKLIPITRGGEHFALAYYSDFGGTASNISKNILFSPLKTISVILQPQKIQYLIELLLPFGLTSLLAPFYLIFAVPDLLINLLSSNTQLHEIYYQYTAAITPFLVISAIYAVSILKKKLPRINDRLIIVYLIGFALISTYLYGPLPGAVHASVDMFTKQVANKQAIDSFLTNIPTRYSIAATNNLGSHLSRRKNIYTIPVGIDKADVILFLLNDKFAQPSLKAQKEMAKNMESNKNYIEVFKQGDFIVFEKRNLYLERRPTAKQISLFPWSIASLQNREYAQSQIVIEKKVSSSKTFSSYVISYLSDGLKQYSLMNIPTSKMPIDGYPVVIINHGFIEPKNYSTINSYKSIADYFSGKGYLVLKPDYRGNGNSETGETTLMRFAYPVDVLNLIASLNNIPQANSNQIYLYGHSMGGEITLKVLEIAGKDQEILAKIKAAVIWAPVTNLTDWFNSSHVPWLQETKNDKDYYASTFKVMGTPETNPLLWQSVSPVNYLSDIQTPIQINHGIADGTVSYRTSIELYDNLISLNKTTNLLMYPGNDHNLTQSWDKATANALSFF